eukprot:2597864-Amphidinium_carterae.1
MTQALIARHASGYFGQHANNLEMVTTKHHLGDVMASGFTCFKFHLDTACSAPCAPRSKRFKSLHLPTCYAGQQ